jgi:tripartite ATP-independent transporter DctM subunit
MSSEVIAGLMILFMLVIMFLRVPIGIAMMLSGVIGYSIIDDFSTLTYYMKGSSFAQMASHSLAVIPLFLFMGNLAARSGISRSLFVGVNAFIGHRRGGLALAAVGGCGLFGAICGSSLATAATMGSVALPEMKRHGYHGALATGALAAGGTLGILIPPSIVLIIYAILTEQNIVKLFMAAMVPGIMAVMGYMLVIAIVVKLNPHYADKTEKASWAERGKALLELIPASILFIGVLGGIYGGVFTPSEAAAYGVVGTIVIALINRQLTWQGFGECIKQTAVNTGMIFVIILGADIFNAFLSLSGMPQALADWIVGAEVTPMLVLLLMLAVYLVLGCLMDSLSMILLTVPIFFPAIMSLDFGMTYEQTALWFGIICLIVVEVGMITPPVGMNVFIINKIADGVPMRDTFIGVLPFLASDFVRVILLLLFPVLTWGIIPD